MKQGNMNPTHTRGRIFAALALATTLCVSLAAQNPQDVKTPPKPPESSGDGVEDLQIKRRSDAADGPQRIKIVARANSVPDGPQKVAISAGAGVADGPVRIKITARAKFYPTVSPEFEFSGANGMVTGLSATSERKTFTFERSPAGMSCPTGKAKECDSINLKDGGSLTACVCLAPDKSKSRPATGAVTPTSADMRYDIALSDRTTLRSSGGGAQTCWVNNKLQMSLCY